jgi:hypothetical protein
MAVQAWWVIALPPPLTENLVERTAGRPDTALGRIRGGSCSPDGTRASVPAGEDAYEQILTEAIVCGVAAFRLTRPG